MIYADSAEMENNFYKSSTLKLCAMFGAGASNDTTHNISKNQSQRIYGF
jgi:hypothetical protein